MNTRTNAPEFATTVFQASRKHLRLPFAGKAELTAMRNGQHLTAQVSEIGPRGCYVDTPEEFTVDTKVIMFIRNADESCVLSGTVLYVHKGWGMGILFDDRQPEAFATLDDWLAEQQTHAVVH
jgi:hypothetical protein